MPGMMVICIITAPTMGLAAGQPADDPIRPRLAEGDS